MPLLDFEVSVTSVTRFKGPTQTMEINSPFVVCVAQGILAL